MGAVGHVNLSTYCASKAGVINITRALALELAPNKINVNAIAPFATDTPMLKPIMDDPNLLRMVFNQIPLGRLAQPEEIAFAAIYLASDESDFVTGHTLFVDGGHTSQ